MSDEMPNEIYAGLTDNGTSYWYAGKPQRGCGTRYIKAPTNEGGVFDKLDQIEKDCELMVHSLRKGYKQGQITFAKRMLSDVVDLRQALSEKDKRIAELMDALKTLEPFVEGDFYENCTTPEYKAAVYKMRESLKGTTDDT